MTNKKETTSLYEQFANVLYEANGIGSGADDCARIAMQYSASENKQLRKDIKDLKRLIIKRDAGIKETNELLRQETTNVHDLQSQLQKKKEEAKYFFDNNEKHIVKANTLEQKLKAKEEICDKLATALEQERTLVMRTRTKFTDEEFELHNKSMEALNQYKGGK